MIARAVATVEPTALDPSDPGLYYAYEQGIKPFASPAETRDYFLEFLIAFVGVGGSVGSETNQDSGEIDGRLEAGPFWDRVLLASDTIV